MADPFVAMNSIQAANQHESLPLFVEYGYDFDKQCFRYDEKGQNLMVTENEALKVWIYKGEVLPTGKNVKHVQNPQGEGAGN